MLKHVLFLLSVWLLLFVQISGPVFSSSPMINEDGYELWLRYRPIEDEKLKKEYADVIRYIVVEGNSQISQSIKDELRDGLLGLLQQSIPLASDVTGGTLAVAIGTSSEVAEKFGLMEQVEKLHPEGFIIKALGDGAEKVTVIASPTDRGALYGAFRFLSQLQSNRSIENLGIRDEPVNDLRLLNHWDNWEPTKFGTIERGYAGETLWQWEQLPNTIDPRYRDYARANASIGINGAVINNVNAQVEFIKTENLPKVAALADEFRKYGIRLYLSIRYDTPIVLGGLDSSDPLDDAVISFWQHKVEEIYSYIPDFGGFLVKGDSEGQPGPLKYNRDHATGANMLAALLKPHDGIIIWRTFVYGISGLSSDRVMQNYEVFQPLDGEFADNVILQAKNGPLDFQVREPVNPVIGGLPNTNVGIELQITQEYTGTNLHLCYLIPQWKEIFNFDTFARGEGSLVKNVLDGSLFGRSLSLVAGVANTGSSKNWTGNFLAQANWHGFGRLAWNPSLEPADIAEEWVRMTYGNHEDVVKTITTILLDSWEIYESYTSPLGLGVMIEGGIDRLRPAPANRVNYHRADADGIGYDRSETGSGYVYQYYPEVANVFNAVETTPEELLLWFHHLPYEYTLSTGGTLIQQLYSSYENGVAGIENAISQWETLRGKIDANRYNVVSLGFRTQLRWAKIWRDECIKYFEQVSGIKQVKYLRKR